MRARRPIHPGYILFEIKLCCTEAGPAGGEGAQGERSHRIARLGLLVAGGSGRHRARPPRCCSPRTVWDVALDPYHRKPRTGRVGGPRRVRAQGRQARVAQLDLTDADRAAGPSSAPSSPPEPLAGVVMCGRPRTSPLGYVSTLPAAAFSEQVARRRPPATFSTCCNPPCRSCARPCGASRRGDHRSRWDRYPKARRARPRAPERPPVQATVGAPSPP